MQKKKTTKEDKKKSKEGAGAKVGKNSRPSDLIWRKESLAVFLAAVPLVLMCVLTVFMLAADLLMSDPDKQYELYPAVSSVTDWAAAAAFTAFVIIKVRSLAGKPGANRQSKNTDAGRKWITTAATYRHWIPWIAFLVCILISTCVNGFTDIAVSGVPYRFIGVPRMAAFVFIYMGLSGCIESRRLVNLAMQGFLLTADFIAAAALYDRYLGAVAAFQSKKELSTVFFNGNHYGYFLLMVVLAGLGLYLFGEGRLAVIGAASSALNLILLVINHSLGSILAFATVFVITVGIILVKDRAKSKRFAAAAAVLITILVFALAINPALRKEFTGLFTDIAAIAGGTASGTEGHRRLQMWTLAWNYTLEKPLFGYGCEGIAFMLYEAMKVSNPHSEILSYAAFYGLPAAILYAAGVIAMLWRTFSGWRTASAGRNAAFMAAAGYFISSFTGVAMFYTTPFFFVFLGIAAGTEPESIIESKSE